MLSGHDFYPFGMEVHTTGQAAKGSSNMRFTGHERDIATGLDYMKARYSGWFQGSFLIPDSGNDVSIKNPQSWNRYAYVRNNPINLVDPNGLESERKVPSQQSPLEQEGTAGVCPDGESGECDAEGVKIDAKDENKKDADDANEEASGEDPVVLQDEPDSANHDGDDDTPGDDDYPDSEYQTYQNLTEAEKEFLARHPVVAADFYAASVQARQEAAKRFPGELHNGRGDAYRHAYWSALMTNMHGVALAREYGDAHESYAGNPPAERAMDLHNNRVGRTLAAMRMGTSPLANEVRAALKGGWLRWITN